MVLCTTCPKCNQHTFERHILFSLDGDSNDEEWIRSNPKCNFIHTIISEDWEI